MQSSESHLPLEQITSYLTHSGWQLASENAQWLLFRGYEDIEGRPLEIALHKDSQAPDYSLSVYHSLRTLASLNRMSQEMISQEILTFDRDILVVRVDDAADSTAIPIEEAASQITELKQLVLYGATSERSRRKHYDTWLPSARTTLDEFAFGHTVAGSFGFRLEAKLVGEQSSDEPALAGFEPRPLSRIVMERIMRGLAATEQAVSDNSTRPLLEGYKTGFNSNMCDSIVKLSQDFARPVQYRMKWSQMFDVSEDVEEVTEVEIKGVHRQYLERASKELALRESSYATVEGVVRTLDSKENPRSEDTAGRSVVVHGGAKGEKWRQIHLILEKEDYLTAIRAHDDWQTVSVRGYLTKVGAKWVLQEPEGLNIIR